MSVLQQVSLCFGVVSVTWSSGEASLSMPESFGTSSTESYVEQKLVLLDVGFAGVSSVLMTSKVGLGSKPVSGLWMARRPNDPLCSGGACGSSSCGPRRR